MATKYDPGRHDPYVQPAPFSPGYRNVSEDQPFKVEKRVNDKFFLVVFLAQLLAFCVVSGIVLTAWIASGASDSMEEQIKDSVILNQQAAILLLIVTLSAFVLSIIQLAVTRVFAKFIIHITCIFTIIVHIGIAVVFALTGAIAPAIIAAVFAAIFIIWYCFVFKRVKLASMLLKLAMDISKHHMSVFAVAFGSLIIQAMLSVWYMFTVVATFAKYTPGSSLCKAEKTCSIGAVIGLIIFETFSFIWTSGVIGNITIATLAGGPYGVWYYKGPRHQDESSKHPTISALGRATTYSLGSIAFGSLIVTFLEMLRMLIHSLKPTDIGCCCILCCCLECIISWIEVAVEYFNRYAYIRIALYGKPYIDSAKDTYHFFKERGLDALANDCLVNIALVWGGYCVGLISAILAFLYLYFTNPKYNSDGSYYAPVTIFAFIIGAQCSMTLSSAIEAGVSTIFVGISTHPQILATRAPDLYYKIRDDYEDFKPTAKIPPRYK